MRSFVAQKIRSAPNTPGVYVFYDQHRMPLYIGKAVNLRARLKNYLKPTDAKTELLEKEARAVKCIVLHSDIEALIIESKLIKTLKPKYNIIWRDDKSYVYVAITKPTNRAKSWQRQIFVIHASRIPEFQKQAEIIGPYTDSGALRLTLKLLRRTFPYCTCTSLHLRNCLNVEIGKCLGFCCKKDATPTIEKKLQYAKNIRVIKNLLPGKLTKIALKKLPINERSAIERILAHRDFLEVVGTAAPKYADRDEPSDFTRAECYDISHLAGKESVGGMTAWVYVNGEWIADKNAWRKFKIRTAKASDDPGAIKEVLNRRFNHPEWNYPDLIIIDGGLGQLNAARYVFLSRNIKNVKLISFAKPEQRVLGLEPRGTPIDKTEPAMRKLVLRAITETHRFAITYHRNFRRKKILEN